MITLAVLLCLSGVALSNASCGVKPPGSRIVGGGIAQPHSWPWQLSLRSGRYHICGAALISPQWAVTAGHCVAKTQDTTKYTVVAGAHNNVKDGTIYRLSKIIIHEDYRHVFNDVALLKFEGKVALDDKVGTVCLPQQDDKVPAGSMCYMTGWGRFSGTHPAGSRMLKETIAPIVGYTDCVKKNGVTLNDTTMVCAGGDGSSICMGDSGGPLSCEENGRWVLRGAASWVTTQSCKTNTYSVYARVSNFMDWINAKIKADGEGNGGNGGDGGNGGNGGDGGNGGNGGDGGDGGNGGDGGGGGDGGNGGDGGGGGNVCRDEHSNCQLFASMCKYNPEIKRICRKTCKMCS